MFIFNFLSAIVFDTQEYKDDNGIPWGKVPDLRAWLSQTKLWIGQEPVILKQIKESLLTEASLAVIDYAHSDIKNNVR